MKGLCKDSSPRSRELEPRRVDVLRPQASSSRGVLMGTRPIEIRYELLDDCERAAFEKLVSEDTDVGYNTVCVRPFQRFGFSGAKLLLVFFHEQHRGKPFVVKINSAS